MDISPYEAIVVGSGATGGIAALTLAEQGIKVLVIEAGPQVKRHEASNHEPKSTLKRLSGVLTKKHANQCQHPGYWKNNPDLYSCLLYTSPSPRDREKSRMPSSA